MLDIILLSALKILGTVGAICAIIGCTFLLFLFIVSGICEWKDEIKERKGKKDE